MQMYYDTAAPVSTLYGSNLIHLYQMLFLFLTKLP